MCPRCYCKHKFKHQRRVDLANVNAQRQNFYNESPMHRVTRPFRIRITSNDMTFSTNTI